MSKVIFVTKADIDALDKGIEKWQHAGETKDFDRVGGVSDCKLCYMYYEKSCVGCPVHAYTGRTLCDGTPYDEFTDAYDEFADEYDTAAQACLNEAQFLRDVKAVCVVAEEGADQRVA